MTADRLHSDALAVWTAAVDAVRPERLIADAVAEFPAEWHAALRSAPRVLVVGGGKAGTAMAAGWEAAFPNLLGKTTGLVNVPGGQTPPVASVGRVIRRHPARPAGSNHPTEAGVAGTAEMLRLLESAGPDDVAVCLISGGGSALLPAPADGITLADKQAVTKLLHASGATIPEMNAVRKHLSRVKGGRLATAFRGQLLMSLLISDVVGDPLDVIASGPTAPDPTTFADALAVLDRFGLTDRVPPTVLNILTRGDRGELPETPTQLPPHVQNRVIGNNQTALVAATVAAEARGYRVVNLGPFVEGEAREVGVVVAGIARAIRDVGVPVSPPACLLIGGETTVTLGDTPGRGGRNQEFVLAAALQLAGVGLDRVAILSGGTDGEDGPTDAAGAIATADIWQRGQNLNPADHLARHDAYPFFDACNGLIRTGLTNTNVMDVRVILAR